MEEIANRSDITSSKTDVNGLKQLISIKDGSTALVSLQNFLEHCIGELQELLKKRTVMGCFLPSSPLICLSLGMNCFI